MSTPNKGSRRLATDTTQAPPDSPRHDDAAPDHRAHSDPGQVHSTKRPSTNLVLPRSPLIGREHEVAAVQHLLLQERVGLLTLTGPGGIGKTRLALQVATTLLDHFVDGDYFVSLASIRDADLVIAAIAETLGVREVGGQPLLEALQAYLQHRQMLLVLDNFEQVVVAAPLVAALLEKCHRLKILVTSRATLHLYGEQEFPVPPLALPDPKRLRTMGIDIAPNLAQAASVSLFVQRAMAVQPDFALSATNAAVVAEICIALDGLPLAIELAAAKIKLFSPLALLARLQQPLTLLMGGAHDLPARQRTLRDEIAWSYELLADGEQTLFRRLAVFAGGFTFAAAQAVCNAAGDLGVEVFSGVASLVDQNLLKQAEQARPRGGSPLETESRFDMLEMMREYALEQLAASGEAEAIRHQHTSFFLALSEANPGLPSKQLTMEHDNLRTALAWSLAEPDRTEIALRLTNSLREFWTVSGYWSEGRRWSEAALALTTAADHTEVRAAALIDAGALAGEQGDHLTARVRLEQGLALAKELGTKQLMLNALVNLSFIAHVQHNNAMALAQLGEALTFARELENKGEIASIFMFLGNLARDENNYAGAQSLYEESLALFHELGDDFSIAAVRHFQGLLAQAQGDYERARDYFMESITRWRTLGTLQWKGVDECLEGVAHICVLQRQFEEAARLFAAAEVIRELRWGSLPVPIHSSAEEKHAALRAELGEAAFAAAWAAGRALSAEEVVDYVLALPAMSAPIPLRSSLLLSAPITYPGGLTAREVEVLRLLAQGLTYAQIAEILIISRRTVNGHVTSIYSKLGVTARVAATRFAMEHRLV